MVAGIDSFRDKFRGFEDCYTVIGGAACDILMSEADIDFMLTKDIDMILLKITFVHLSTLILIYMFHNKLYQFF